MDHRQLEVSSGVVHRNATCLGDDNHEEPGKGENVGRMQGDPLLHERSDQHAEVHGAGGKGGRKQSQHEGRLGERGDGHVAAGAHSAEWTQCPTRQCEGEATPAPESPPATEFHQPLEQHSREHHAGVVAASGCGKVHTPTGSVIHDATSDRTGSFRNGFVQVVYPCRSGGP